MLIILYNISLIYQKIRGKPIEDEKTHSQTGSPREKKRILSKNKKKIHKEKTP